MQTRPLVTSTCNQKQRLRSRMRMFSHSIACNNRNALLNLRRRVPSDVPLGGGSSHECRDYQCDCDGLPFDDLDLLPTYDESCASQDCMECPLCSEPTASVSRDERFSCTKCNFNMKLQGDSIGMETVVDALYDAIWQHNSKGCVCRPKFVLSENFQNSNVDLLFLSCDKCGAFNLAL
eukprot:GHVR01113611.1.p1 GENE.GHVR01113611.1~~GHVR01113611.1.p1  ORF type:complete len:178 (+),score=26.19 GHVR01113611.1:50-583(+)